MEEEKILKQIEDLSGEYAWVYRQGDSSEKYNISKDSFIEGAKTVISILKGELYGNDDNRTIDS